MYGRMLRKAWWGHPVRGSEVAASRHGVAGRNGPSRKTQPSLAYSYARGHKSPKQNEILVLSQSQSHIRSFG